MEDKVPPYVYIMLDKTSLDILKYSNDPVLFTRDLIGLKCEWFHQEWLEAFEKNRFTVLLAPRGHGKTSIVGSYILWRICRNRNIRILIVTINQNKANAMMTFIQENLSKNNRLIDTFGEFRGYSNWSRDQIRVKQLGRNVIPHNEPTLQVLGVSSRVISAHYDLIILDDLTDSDNSRTEVRRRQLEDWYNGDIIGTFLEDTQLINIGTRWHQDDIHNFFVNKEGFKTLTYKALLNEEEVAQGKPAKVLWPEHLPWNEEMAIQYEKDPNALNLKFIRAHQGEVYFQMQYQNNIIASGLSKFKPEWVERAITNFRKLDGILPLNLKKYIGVDIGGEDKTSDWGVSTVIGVDEKGDIYVIDSVRTHSSPNRQFEIMKALDDKYYAPRIGMESVAQQKHMVSDVAKKNPNLPILPIKSSWVNDRETRTDRLSILFETNRIYLNPKLTYLIDELHVYPRGKHDDSIDSLSFALEASQKGGIIDWSRVNDVMSARSSTKSKLHKI